MRFVWCVVHARQSTLLPSRMAKIFKAIQQNKGALGDDCKRNGLAGARQKINREVVCVIKHLRQKLTDHRCCFAEKA